MPETQAPVPLPGILSEIVLEKRREVERLRERGNAAEAALVDAPPPRDFAAALRDGSSVALIAECKRRSPGAGDIRVGLEPAELAAAYERHGASALSVLTDARFFGGCADDLITARAAVHLPVLRKDFTLDPLQIVEARGMGADAILLIVRILDDDSLTSLLAEAEGFGMTALVEVHDSRELGRAIEAGARVVGINNRDLSTFTTDIDTTMRILDEVPDDVVVVSESGIRTRADVEALGARGVHAVLVGEALLCAEHPGRAAAELAGVPRASRSGVPATG